MKTVKVNTKNLLETVKTNRDKHIAEYNEAVEGYKQGSLCEVRKRLVDVKKSFATLLNKIETSDTPVVLTLDANLYCLLEMPVSHENDYNQVIKMLEMSVDEELEVTYEEFSRYVMDEWKWKTEFTTMVGNNKRYKA